MKNTLNIRIAEKGVAESCSVLTSSGQFICTAKDLGTAEGLVTIINAVNDTGVALVHAATTPPEEVA